MEHISGQYIKHLREERGLTLRSFAEQIYASKSSVYRWEQAHVPENEDILQRIAAVFGTDVAALRDGSAQFTARQRAEQTAGGAEDTANEAEDTADAFHSGAAAKAQTEGAQSAASGAQSAASGALPITGEAQIAAERAKDGAAGAAEEAQAEGDDDFGLDPDQVAEMKFGIKWLGWAIGLLAAAALILMAVFAAL